MSQHEVRVSLQQILEHSREAIEMVGSRTRADLDSNRILNLALVRLLEIVGEAANRIPRAEQDRFPQIPWPEIVGLRNRLIHGYDQVDFDIIWQILTQDLPQLVRQLEGIVSASTD